jgi:tetratricopeptide (TPR) repeat protein
MIRALPFVLFLVLAPAVALSQPPTPAPATSDQLHIAIREIPAVLALPATNGPDDPNARLGRAYAQLEKRLRFPSGSLAAGVPAFAANLLKSPETPPLEHAGAQFALRHYAEAESEALRLAASSGPETAKAWQLAGRSATQQHLFDRAREHYAKAVELSPKESDPREWAMAERDIAILDLATGKLAEAEEIWRENLKINLTRLPPGHPDLISSRNVLANTLSKEGKFADAVEQYREIVVALEKTRGPGHPDIVRARQNLERALKSASEAK